MDKPIDALRREHRLARRMVEVLVALADRIIQRIPASPSDLGLVLEFFREFVESVHHRKEAAVFYPYVAMAGGSHSAERVGALIADHDQSAELLRLLLGLARTPDVGTAEAEAFAALARTYGTRLVRHMEAEEATLFPLFARIPGDDRIRCCEEFARIEAAHRARELWEVELARLEDLYLRSPPDPRSTTAR